MKIIGAVLIVVGLLGILYGGMTFSHKEKVVDAGPLQISKTDHDRVPIPPIAGAVLLVAGIVMVMRPGRGV